MESRRLVLQPGLYQRIHSLLYEKITMVGHPRCCV